VRGRSLVGAVGSCTLLLSLRPRHPRCALASDGILNFEMDSVSRALEFALAHVASRVVRPHIRSMCVDFVGHSPGSGSALPSTHVGAARGNESRFLASVEANPVTTALRHEALAGSFPSSRRSFFPDRTSSRGGLSSFRSRTFEAR
jgi:hypothetical protein